MSGGRWKSPEARERSLMALAESRYLRWVVDLTKGKHCHPLVNTLVDEMNAQKVSFNALGRRAGVPGSTIRRWRNERNPSFPDIEAAFNALGYDLKPVRRRERIAA